MKIGENYAINFDKWANTFILYGSHRCWQSSKNKHINSQANLHEQCVPGFGCSWNSGCAVLTDKETCLILAAGRWPKGF